MTTTSDDPSFIKLNTKVSVLLGLLGLGVPALLTVLGFGVSRLIDIQEEVGIVCMLQSDMHRVEDRLNKHIEEDKRKFNVNSFSYLKEDDLLKKCHFVNTVLTN